MLIMELRRDVLKVFKSLHRARTIVFDGDDHALHAVRKKINEEFQKNKQEKDENAIKEMIKFATDVETELRTSVVQAREVEPGRYEVRIREETTKLDNYPYQDVPEQLLTVNKKKTSRKCKEEDKT